MAPTRIWIVPVTDFNHDGKPDAVVLQDRETMIKARDKRGRKTTISEQSVEMRPMVATETPGMYAPFQVQDACKVREDFARIKAGTYKEEGTFWRYTSADIPFASAAGGTPFYVGQTVTSVGQKKPQRIEAFRVGVHLVRSEGADRYVFGPVEAMFAGCRAVGLGQLVPVKK